MFRLVKRQMAFEWERTLFVCLAIGAALAVVFLLEGFMQGLLGQLRNAVLARGGDLIVTQAGVANFIASHSVLPQSSRAAIEAIDGVDTAHPMALVPVIYQRGDRKTPIFLVVYDTAGGPVDTNPPNALPAPGEIIIDESLADLQGLSVGEPFILSKYRFKIGSITRDSAAMFTPFAFITYDDLIDFYFNSDLVGDITTLPLLSFLIVDLADGADAGRVAATIEATVEAVDVFRPSRLAANDVALGSNLFGSVMHVLIQISYVICLLVVSVIMFAAASDRRRSLGVLRALGFSSRTLAGSLLLEAVVLTSLAIPLGLAAAHIAAWLIETNNPLYRIDVLTPGPVLRTVAAAFAVAAVAAALPMRLVARLDPLIVLQG